MILGQVGLAGRPPSVEELGSPVPEVQMAVQVTKGDQIALVVGLLFLVVVLAASAKYFAGGQ